MATQSMAENDYWEGCTGVCKRSPWEKVHELEFAEGVADEEEKLLGEPIEPAFRATEEEEGC